MANHAISWVPGAHVRFGTLDFIVTREGGLECSEAPASLPRVHASTVAESSELVAMADFNFDEDCLLDDESDTTSSRASRECLMVEVGELASGGEAPAQTNPRNQGCP